MTQQTVVAENAPKTIDLQADLARLPKPNNSLESWRHFSCPEWQLPVVPADHDADVLPQDAQDWLAELKTQPGCFVVLVNGRFVASESSTNFPAGLEVIDCLHSNPCHSDADVDYDQWLDHQDCTQWYVNNRLHATGGIRLNLTENTVLTAPIYLLEIYTSDVPGVQRNHFVFELGSQATLINAGFVANAAMATQHHSLTYWHLATAAQVRIEHLMAGSQQTTLLKHHYINLEQNSSLTGLTFQLAGHRLQELFWVKLMGLNAQLSLKSLACPGRNEQHHCALHVEHQQPHTQTQHEVKMLVGQQARGICYSNVLMQAGVDGATSKQTNRNLAVDDSAAVFTQPRLVIHHDQVQCAHGATTGRLDQRMLRYLMSRGLSFVAARNMLMSGFVDEWVNLSESSWLMAHAHAILAKQWSKLLVEE